MHPRTSSFTERINSKSQQARGTRSGIVDHGHIAGKKLSSYVGATGLTGA